MKPKTKKRIAAATVAVVLIAGIAGAYSARQLLRQRGLSAALETGMAAYERKDYPVAMQNLGQYVGRHKDDAKPMLALADCRRRIREENGRHLITALSIARAAAEVAPAQSEPLEMVLELCEQLGFNTEAQDTACRLLAIDPNHAAALKARTRALAMVGSKKEALESANDWLSRHPKSIDANEAKLFLLQSLGTPDAEVQAFAEQAANDNPDDVAFAMLKCRTLMALRRIDEATAAAKYVATLPIRTREQLRQLVGILQVLQLTDESKAVLATSRSNQALADEAWLIEAERAWKLGDNGRAKECVASMSASQERSDRELALRCIIAVDAAEAVQSREAIREIGVQSTPAAAYWAGILRGREYLLKDDLPHAEAEFSSAASMDSGPGYAQFFLGQVHARGRDWRRAAEQYISATAADPFWTTARTASISLLDRTGQLDEALDQARQGYLATHMLLDAVQYARIAVALMEEGRAESRLTSEIMIDLEKIKNDRPDNAYVLALLARAKLATGDKDRAAELTEKLLTLADPPPLDSISRLAIGFRRAGYPVADKLDALIDRAAPPVDAAAARSTILAASGNVPAAIASLRAAAAQATGDDRTRLQAQLGLLLDATGDPGARDVLVPLAEANPSKVELQLGILNSQFAWSDEAVINGALARLAAVVGEDSDVWKLHDARRMLTFPESGPKALTIEAVAAKVGLNLMKINRKDPGNTAIAMVLAEAQALLKERDQAIDTLTRAANAAPNEWTVYPRLIDLLQLSGRATEAAQRLTRFRAQGSLPLPIQRQRARLLDRQGLQAEYMNDLSDLAARGGADDRLAYAIELARAGDAAKAKPLFDALLAEPTVSARAVVAAAEFVDATQGLEAGLAVLAGVPAGVDAASLKTEKARLLARHDRKDEAEAIYRELTVGGGPDAWANLAQFLIDNGKMDEAAKAVESGRAATPNAPSLLWLAAMVKLKSGSEANAATIKELTDALNSPETAPDFRDIAMALRAYGQDSDQKKLVEALEKITKTYPSSFLAWRELTNAYAQAGKLDDAVKAASSAAQSIPGDPRAPQLAAEVLMAANRLPEAAAMASRWRATTPQDTLRPDLLRARIAYLQRRFVEAAEILSPFRARLEEAGDKGADSLELYAACLASAGRESEARDLLKSRAEGNPLWHIRYLRTTQALLSQLDKARAWADAIPIGESSQASVAITAAQAWSAIYSASNKPEDLDRAMHFAQLASNDDAFSGPALSMLANAYHMKGELDTAVSTYRAALDKSPDDPALLNNLAYLIAITKPSEEAYKLASRAVDFADKQRMPDGVRANFMETLGYCALKLRNFKDAESAFQRGLALNPAGLDLLVGFAEANQGLPNQTAKVTETLERIQTLIGQGQRPTPELTARIEQVRLKNPG